MIEFRKRFIIRKTRYYRAYFRHHCGDTGTGLRLPRGQRQASICVIEVKGPDGWVKDGEWNSWINHKDQFCRRIGRKIAFKRALAGLDLDKKDRAAAWEAYFVKIPADRGKPIPRSG